MYPKGKNYFYYYKIIFTHKNAKLFYKIIAVSFIVIFRP